MARIRSIHPGFFTDDEIAELSDSATLFLIGLMTQADDQGVFEWKPAQLRIRLRPCKDGSADVLLSELEAAKRIKAFDIEGRKHGAIRNFRRYQKPKTPNALYVITPDIRKYVGLEPCVSEIAEAQPSPFPPKVEMTPQREEGGGVGSSEPNGSGAESAAFDPEAVIFDHGRRYLESCGIPDKQARSLLGKWRKSLGDGGLIDSLGDAKRDNIQDPVAWMEGVIKQRIKRPAKSAGYVPMGVGG